jgi:methylenetetrahydrofolate--tRNA-(uracil-5-)-methyltransferase
MRIERRVVDELPAGPVIMATGPLTGGRLAHEVRHELGGERLYFYDAIAPIVDAETIDWERAFRASRWGGPGNEDGVGDYVNCPLGREEYEAFVAAVRAGRKVTPHDFEEPRYFESCMPIEVMAERGDDVCLRSDAPRRPE